MKVFSDLNEVHDWLNENGFEDTVPFANPDYVGAIIGISCCGSLIYSYTKMVECLMIQDKMTEEDAIDFINYNTIGSLQRNQSYYPIILFDIS